MKIIPNDMQYYYTVIPLRKGSVNWSESVVEYKLYYNENIIKKEVCEEHLVEKYINEDIHTHKLKTTLLN
jgi:hypothetical protein